MKENDRMEPVQRKFRAIVVLTCLAVLMSAGCPASPPLGSERNPVKLAFVPSVDRKLIDANAKVIQTILEKITPYRYRITTPETYDAAWQALGNGNADVAALNTLGYIDANEQYGAQARLVQARFGSTTYQGAIFVHADSTVGAIEDLTGKHVALVDPRSTSGCLLPMMLLKDKSVVLRGTVFAHTHDAAISMVYRRQADAAAAFYSPPDTDGRIQDARRLLFQQYPDVAEKIKVVQLTASIPNDPIVFRKELTEAMKTSIADALVAMMGTKDGYDAWHSTYGATGFKKITDEIYGPVRMIFQGKAEPCSNSGPVTE